MIKILRDLEYKNWLNYYIPHLEKMFDILTYKSNIKDLSFYRFCSLVYKKSSKRIPSY